MPHPPLDKIGGGYGELLVLDEFASVRPEHDPSEIAPFFNIAKELETTLDLFGSANLTMVLSSIALTSWSNILFPSPEGIPAVIWSAILGTQHRPALGDVPSP